MKNVITSIFSLLIITSTAAYADDRIEQILNSQNIAKSVAQFETDRSVDCIAPKEHQIHWMCTNGGYCGFALDITCISRIGDFDTNDQIVRLSILGHVGQDGVIFTPEYNQVTEYKKLTH